MDEAQKEPQGFRGEAWIRRDPREVVETYCHPDPREAVEYYISGYRLPGQEPPIVLRSPKKRRRGLWIGLSCLAVVLAITAGTLIWRYTQGEAVLPPEVDGGPSFAYDYEEGSGEVFIPQYPLGGDMRMEISTTHDGALMPQEIYQLVNPSVVTVMVQLDRGMSVGTGILLTEDGYILTNFHVVEDGNDCSVALYNNAIFEAKFVAGDQDNDIAVIKVDATGLPAAQIGDSDALNVGDTVYAIGNPLGLELRGTFTDGIVSAINRDVQVDGRTMTLVQTNAALNSGNSGGPLINQYGQVVGVNTIKMMSKEDTIEGLGFALPTSIVFRMVNDLVQTGEVRPETELGIVVLSLAQLLPDGKAGLAVESVTAGSAAEEAGLKAGDFIVAAQGQNLATSSDLQRIRRTLVAGDGLELTVWRDGKYVDLTVILREAKPGKG